MAVEGYDVLASEVAYDSGFTRVRVDRVRMPGGEATREVVETADAVAAVALDGDGRVVLVEQYRHPLGARAWELPAGKLDVEGEDTEAACQRELAEEVGLRAGRLELLGTFANSAGWTSERTTLYLASELTAVGPPAGFTADHEEADLAVRRVLLDDAVAEVEDGTITDGKTVVGLLLAARRRGGGGNAA